MSALTIRIGGKGEVFGSPIVPAAFGVHYTAGSVHDSLGALVPPVGYNFAFPDDRRIGQGSYRHHDGRFLAYINNPASGVFWREPIDYFKALNTAIGSPGLLPLGRNAAEWATGVPPNGSLLNPYAYLDLADLDAYARWAMGIGGTSFIYENVNEPNSDNYVTGVGGWQAEVDNVVAEHATIFAARNAVAPAALICSASPTGRSTGVAWLDSFARRGGLDYVDIVGCHTYAQPSQPEVLYGLVGQYRQKLAQFGKSALPLWITECGYQQFTDPVTRQPRNEGGLSAAVDLMSDAMAAAYMHRMHLAAFSGGAERLYLYGFNQTWTAMRLFSTSTPSSWPNLPLAGAYAFMCGFLSGARLGQLRSRDGVFRLAFQLADSRRGKAFWCADGRTITLDLSHCSEIRDVNGAAQAPSATFAVGNSPIYAIWA